MFEKYISYLSDEVKIDRIVWIFIGIYLLLTVLGFFLPPILYQAMVAVLGLVFALAVMIKTEIGLFTLIFFLPFDLFTSAEVFDYTLKTSQVIALVTSASLVMRKIRMRDFNLVKTPLRWPLGLLLFANACSLFYAIDRAKGTLYLGWSIFMVVAVYFMVINLIINREILERSIKFLFLSAGLLSLFGVYQFIGDYLGLPTGLLVRYTKASNLLPRIHTFALEPLYWANYLLLVIPIIIAFLLYRSSLIDRRWGIALFALLAFNLIFTVSRGGWIGMAAAGIVIYLLYIREDRRRRLQVVKFLPIIVLAAIVLGSSFYFIPKGRDLAIKSVNLLRRENFIITAEGVRLKGWVTAFNMFTTSPIIGVGVGNYGPNYHRYLPPSYGYPSEPAYEPLPVGSGRGITNNITLEIMSETGVLGLSAYLGILAVTILLLWRIFRKAESPFWRMISLGLVAGFIGIFVQYQFFSTFYIMHVWFTLGLITAVGNIVKSEEVMGN